MSLFKNLLRATLWLTSPDGERVQLSPDEEFNGSNFYKKYTSRGGATGDNIMLSILVDDGIPYLGQGDGPPEIPNTLKSWEMSVSNNDSWTDHEVIFSSTNVFGTPAQFLQIVVDDSEVQVKINNDDASIFRMDADSTQTFNTGELLIGRVSFKNPITSGGIPAVVRIMAATVAVN